LKEIFKQAFDNLKKGARDLLHPVPMSESGHDRIFHPAYLNKVYDPPFLDEEVKIEWAMMLLLQVRFL